MFLFTPSVVLPKNDGFLSFLKKIHPACLFDPAPFIFDKKLEPAHFKIDIAHLFETIEYLKNNGDSSLKNPCLITQRQGTILQNSTQSF